MTKRNIFTGKKNIKLFIRNKRNLLRRHKVISESSIKKALQKRLDIQQCKIAPIIDGMGSAAFAITTNKKDRLFLKVQPFSDVSPISYEWVFLEIVRKVCSVLPIPKPVLLDTTGDLIHYPYMVCSWHDGKSLLSLLEEQVDIDLIKYVRSLANVFQLLHNSCITCQGYGRFDPAWVSSFLKNPVSGSLKIKGEYKYTPQNIYRPLFVLCKQIKPLSLITQNQIAEINKLSEGLSNLPTRLTLVHGDPSLRNFIYNNGILTAIVDPSGKIGPPVEELAWVFVFLQDIFRINPKYDPDTVVNGQ